MAHYAKVEEGIVTQVIVASEDFIQSGLVGEPWKWIKTSYNTRGGVHFDPETGLPSEDQSKALRKNYAGVGYTYDRDLDAFYSPQPYPSWTLDKETCTWQCPVPYPQDPAGEFAYIWDEENQVWEQMTE